jgi:hypothetical protein
MTMTDVIAGANGEQDAMRDALRSFLERHAPTHVVSAGVVRDGRAI